MASDCTHSTLFCHDKELYSPLTEKVTFWPTWRRSINRKKLPLVQVVEPICPLGYCVLHICKRICFVAKLSGAHCPVQTPKVSKWCSELSLSETLMCSWPPTSMCFLCSDLVSAHKVVRPPYCTRGSPENSLALLSLWIVCYFCCLSDSSEGLLPLSLVFEFTF